MTAESLAAIDGAFDGPDARSDSGSLLADRLARLLDLIGSPVVVGGKPLHGGASGDASTLLVDVTMARVMRTPRLPTIARLGTSERAVTKLSDQSLIELDGLVDHSWESDNGEDHARRVVGLLDLGLPAPTPAERRSLIESTLVRIDSAIDSGRQRFRLPPATELAPVGAGSFRRVEIGSIAAVIALSFALLWPMLNGAREQSRQTACLSNLGQAAAGFGMYASDHRDALPHAQASFFGRKWWDVGQPRSSHSANLFRLVSGRYAALGDLACPGNHAAPVRLEDPDAADWSTPGEVSYSYRLFTDQQPGWSAGVRFVVLADRSPVVDRARRGERIVPTMNSLNHSGRGQVLLLSDGSAVWTVSPFVGRGDNIWLPRQMEALQSPALTGRERPSSASDTFLGP